MEKTLSTVTNEREAMPEAQLWRAVIANTVEEWISGPIRRQREAEQYLFHDNTDFRLVCESAGMDADSLRRKLEKFRKQPVGQVDCQVAA